MCRRIVVDLEIIEAEDAAGIAGPVIGESGRSRAGLRVAVGSVIQAIWDGAWTALNDIAEARVERDVD